jgi:hypothetical protein
MRLRIGSTRDTLPHQAFLWHTILMLKGPQGQFHPGTRILLCVLIVAPLAVILALALGLLTVIPAAFRGPIAVAGVIALPYIARNCVFLLEKWRNPCRP